METCELEQRAEDGEGELKPRRQEQRRKVLQQSLRRTRLERQLHSVLEYPHSSDFGSLAVGIVCESFELGGDEIPVLGKEAARAGGSLPVRAEEVEGGAGGGGGSGEGFEGEGLFGGGERLERRLINAK